MAKWKRYKNLQDKIKDNIVVDSITGCWNWIHAKFTNGYGCIVWENRTYSTHRAAYIAWKGKIKKGLYVCHSCDNKGCCNPKHLWVGTVQDNMRDRNNKNRQAFGDRNGTRTHPEKRKYAEDNSKSKVTADQVRNIRSRYRLGRSTTKELSEHYGLCVEQIRRIIRKEYWRNI